MVSEQKPGSKDSLASMSLVTYLREEECDIRNFTNFFIDSGLPKGGIVR